MMDRRRNVPAKNAEHQVEHEERAENDERYKVDPVETAAESVIRLPSKHHDTSKDAT